MSTSSLARHRHTAERAATRIFGVDHGSYDDAVQEAVISIWKTEQKRGPVSEALAYTIAKGRLYNILKSPSGLTGHERTVVHASKVQVSSIDSVADGSWVEHSPRLADPVDHATRCEAAADVRSALCTLDPTVREYVHVRFWEDASEQRLSEVTGRAPVTSRKDWRTKYRPAVQRALENRGVTHAY